MEAGLVRSILNGLLEEVAEAGVLVSAHPNAIRKMGTKEVLYRTRSMSWGCDTRLYRTFRSLCEELPRSLGAGAPRVLKQDRVNAGNGVWQVESAAPTARGNQAPAPYTRSRDPHTNPPSDPTPLPLGASHPPLPPS